MVRRTDDRLEKDLWDLGDIQSGRYIEIEQAKDRPMEVVSGGLRDYTPNYYPKPRLNELTRVIQSLSTEYQQLFTLRYVGIQVNDYFVPLEINTLSKCMKWSRRKTYSRLKDMKKAIKDKMPTYTKLLTIAPNTLKCNIFKYPNPDPETNL